MYFSCGMTKLTMVGANWGENVVRSRPLPGLALCLRKGRHLPLRVFWSSASGARDVSLPGLRRLKDGELTCIQARA